MRTMQLVWVFQCQAEYFLLVILFLSLFILIMFCNKILKKIKRKSSVIIFCLNSLQLVLTAKYFKGNLLWSL